MNRSFPAKLLLFGEYSVLTGSDACAFPLEKFSGQLIFPDPGEERSSRLVESNQHLKGLLTYLLEPDYLPVASNLLRMASLSYDIGSGLAFDSDIPRNYGAGSSGALVAAIYHAYRINTEITDIQSVRTHLAFIESAFHSKSSGIDPLVSYLNKPVFIIDGQIHCPDLKLETIRKHLLIELIDSGIPGKTKSGMLAFQSGSIQTEAQEIAFKNAYIPLINSTIYDIYHQIHSGLIDKIFRIADMQLQLFPDLFTPEIRILAHQGLKSKAFAIKLCGSGGGGFYLKIQPIQP